MNNVIKKDFGGFEVSLSENDDRYIISAKLPDLSSDNVKVSLNDNFLKITTTESYERSDSDYFESYSGSFMRGFNLNNAKGDFSESFSDGVLRVEVPKS